jgi:hypothetical protein
MTTARNFSRKFKEVCAEIASRYFPCHQGLLTLHNENRKVPDRYASVREWRQSREKMDIGRKKIAIRAGDKGYL